MKHDYCKGANSPIVYDEAICVGCNLCVDVCRRDILMPNPVRGGSPIVAYPEECWYCGVCVSDCPRDGAIAMRQPLNQRIGFVRKATGEFFRTR